MKKYFYSLGALTLALNVGALPAVSGVPSVPVQVSIPDIEQDFDDIRVGNVRVSSDGQNGTNVRVGDVQVTSDERGGSKVRVGDIEIRAGGEDDSITVGGMKFELERNVTSVFSFDDLKQSMEQRKQELEDELASTTSQTQDILEGANQVRLAVHALLASKDMLGGIGQQVSQIAQQMNDSVATTTNAETKIQSRSFFSNLLFGGDRGAADTISKEVTKGQENITKLTELLNQTNVSTEVQTTLEAQINALRVEQERLQDLAKKEKSRWGIFSWRFF
ncbi:MAG: hypothetical protein AAB794_03275 [Patescibacteria group bacterium]